MSSSTTPAFAASSAVTGSGDGVFVSVDGGTTFLQVMQTNKMAYSGRKQNFTDTTTTTSPRAVEEFVATTKSPGSFTFELTFLSTDPGQLALAAAYDAQTKLLVKHVYHATTGFSTGANNAFSCYVEEFPLPGSDVTAATKINVSLKITGLITRTAAAV